MKFGFFSCMSGMNWGGSETLWYKTALRLLEDGHEVSVNFRWWNHVARQLTELENKGATISFRGAPTRIEKFRGQASKTPRPSADARESLRWLSKERPDQLLISLGYHPDRIVLAQRCIDLGIPYSINLQCASSSVFIPSPRLEEFRVAYANAARVFVVSNENREKLETNLAMKLDNAHLISNPFEVEWETPVSWPEAEDDTLRLACVGRIHFASKGQDLLVHALRDEKWSGRKIVIGIVGKSQGNEQQLRDLISLHGLEEHFEFEGFQRDISKLWERYHGLVLPSRYEGAALVVTEAMLSHRAVIATDTGRNRELVDEGETGFIADYPDATQLSNVLDLAWQQRASLQAMGTRAGQRIRERFDPDPVGSFKQQLLNLSNA